MILTFIALLSLGASIEDVRGHYEWTALTKAHADRGDPLDVLPPPPPAIPVAENFFGNPMLARLYFAKSTNSEIAALNRSVPIAGQPVAMKWTNGEPVDFAAICELIAEKYPQKKPPTHLAQEPPATRLLAHLSGANHILSEFRHSALYRAHSQPVRSTPTRLENVFKTDMPSWQFTRFTTQVLTLHACASLAAGDTKTAFADTLAGLQFSRGAAASSDTLVEAMIATVAVKIALQPVWEGIHTHIWNEAQLARFQATLSATDIFSALQRGLIIERNGALVLLPARIPFLPSGWIHQNRAYYARYYTTEIDTVASHTSPAFLPNIAAAEAREKNLAEGPHIHPYRFYARWAIPQLHKLTRHVAFSVNATRLATTACALERHRLVHGAYPDSLTALVPAYLPAVPLDVIDGSPLRFRRNADATFTLYSVGPDGDDDNGTRVADLTKYSADSDGDWAW